MRLLPRVLLVAAALSAVDVMATPTTVNVVDCYPAATPTDTEALKKAIAVASGLAAGINTACGVPGSTVYIGTVYVPPKSLTLSLNYWDLTEPLLITKALTITGVRGSHLRSTDAPAGGTGTRIRSSGSIAKMIHVKTNDPVLIEDLTLEADSQPAASSAIYVENEAILDAPPTEQEVATIERVTVVRARTGITLAQSSKATVRSAFIKDFKENGIRVANGFHADRGDSLIEGCWIATNSATGAGILQNSSGGLKIIGNKIVNGAVAGYKLAGANLVGSPLTGILIIEGNSIEGHTSAGIALTRGDALFQFAQVVISNNQFSTQPTGVLIFDDTFAAPVPPSTERWLKGVSITGNQFRAHNVAGISLYEAEGVFIGSNTFANMSGMGIYVDAGTGGHAVPTSVRIGPNTFAASVLGTHISNGGGATLCPPSNCN